MDMPTFPRDAPQDLANLHHCIDALVRGEWTEEEFLSETLDLLEGEADLNWDALAYIDQHYRRGQLDERTFQSIKSQIAQRAVGERSGAQACRDGVTVELFPVRRTAPVKAGSLAAAGKLGLAVGAPAYPRPAVPAPVVPGLAADAPGNAALEIGRVLRNRYRVKRLLGRGGMGDVYEAVDLSGDVGAQPKGQVAIKVLREKFDQRPELMARLRREFACTRKLSHPNIVKVFEFDRVDDWAFYTMELLEGEGVDDMLAREAGRPLPRPYAWALIGAIGAALAHAHSRNVIHGDLSPKNVMITPGGEVRVLDFGSSTMSNGIAAPAETRVEGAVATTPAYASCELLEGQRADPRDDLYSLACIAFELLAGARWWEDAVCADAVRSPLTRLCATYLTTPTERRGPADPVARFHLGNGARLERVNWMGNVAPRGIEESYGIMVNYVYDPEQIEANHEAFVRGAIVRSAEVDGLLGMTDASAALSRSAKGTRRSRKG